MRQRIQAAAFAGMVASATLPALAAGSATLGVREQASLDIPGAVAAFAVDATVVDVSLQGSRLVLLGRRSGDTVVTVILAAGVETISVRVDPAQAASTIDSLRADSAKGFVEGRYDTALRRATVLVAGSGRVAGHDIRMNAELVRQGERVPGESAYALPSASIEINNPRRSIVLLDQFVQASPLTLGGVVLRGIHLRQAEFEVHAGIAGWNPLDGFAGGESERAASVSRPFAVGGIRVTPHLAWLPDSPGGSRGVAAVTVESGTEADPLRVRADAGFGGSAAAAIDIDWRTPERQAWARAWVRPSGYASLRSAPPPGVQAEGAWTEQFGPGTTLSLSGSASRVQLSLSEAESATARAELRHQIAPGWSGTVAASGGAYRSGAGSELSRGTLAIGTAWDTVSWGGTALYRYQATSAADGGGHGARLSLRAAAQGWRATGFVDAQQQAPTLDLVLQDRSALARAIAGLGLAAAQPEDILRALRENASLLAASGAQIGAVRLNPLRIQAGVDLSWRGSGPWKPRYGLRLLREQVDGVVGSRGSTSATLHAGWQLGASTELTLSLSRWTLQQEGQERLGETGVQVAVRTWLDQPLLALIASGPITGRVVRQDVQGQPQPLAGVEVVLDRSRRTSTDAEGRYRFDRPGAGAHTVEAMLPPGSEAAYFTTPSSVRREAGEQADFALALSGVRVTGVVLSDAGLPLGGVAVNAQGAVGPGTLTDTSGAFRLTAPPGEIRLTLAPETLPPGYDLGALAGRARKVETGQPAVVNFAVRALRSLEGVVTGLREGPVTVSVPELNRSVTTDATGRFVLRRLPPGPITLVAGSSQATVQMPAEPGVVRGVQLPLR